jgi:hypothetical protein
MYTVTKAKRDAGAQHKGDGKFRHPHTVDRSEKSIINVDRAAQSLRHAWFLTAVDMCC